MAKQKKSIKSAEKALAKARVAVTDATRAVRKLDKKTRRKAEALSQELKDAEKAARKSTKKADALKAQQLQGPAVQPISVPPDSRPRVTGDDHPTPTATPTYRELREQAKSKGIPGYSRMDKAALTAALATHP